MSGRNNNRPNQGWDVIVVGARVAGAATAMLLARAGLRVLCVDRSLHGGDTVSTHALMRGGVLQLQRWGLLDALADAGTPPVRRSVFHYGAESDVVSIRPSAGVAALYAPRRTVIDGLLVDAARRAGAKVEFPVRRLVRAGVEAHDPVDVGQGIAIERAIDVAAAVNAGGHLFLDERGVEVPRGEGNQANRLHEHAPPRMLLPA